MLLVLLFLLLLPSTAMPQAPLSANLQQQLVNRWVVSPLTKGGLTWYPAVGKDKGTLANGVNGYQATVRPGGVGEMRFDGVDDQINTGTTVMLANLPAFTICLWFRSAVNPGTQQLYTENVSTWPDMHIVINWASSSEVSFNNYDASAGMETHATPPFAVDSNTWQHVCGVQISKSSAQIYFNGKLAGTSAGSVGTIAPSARTFGASPQATNRFNGALDDICTWTRTLSANEVQQVYIESQNKPPQAFAVYDALFPTVVTTRRGLLNYFTTPR
jgi:hypothetical protein